MKIFIIGLVYYFFMLISFFTYGKVFYIDENIDGKKVKIIKVDLDRGHKVITSVSLSGESLYSLVSKVGGVAGVTGVYFCPVDYSYCGGYNHTHADRIYLGQNFSRRWPDTGARGMFGFDKEGKFLFIQNHLGYAEGVVRQINTDKINDIYYGLSNHPILLINGVNVLSQERDDLLDKKISQTGGKSFICITKDEKKVYMGLIGDINIFHLPYFINKNFGCWNAINLDAGKSMGLIFDKKDYVIPKREIMDAFVVLESPYYKYLSEKHRIIIKEILFFLLDEIRKEGLENYYKKINKINNNLKNKLSKLKKEFEIAVLLELIYLIELYNEQLGS